MTMFAKSMFIALIGLVLLPLTATAAPDKPSETTLISAYVGPSIVYVETTWTARVYDGFNNEYMVEQDGSDKVFTSGSGCTGYIVNPNGYVATAGHCVDPREQLDGFKIAAAEWAVENNYYDGAVSVDDILNFQELRVDGAEEDRRNPDRASIDVSWGTEKDQQYKARVINYQPFDKGDAGLIKVEATGLQAIKLGDSSSVENGTEIVSIGYPGKVDEIVDVDYSPSYKDGQVNSKKTRGGGLYTFFEVSSAVDHGMSGGPTVNLDGDVIGFNSFGHPDSERFNFVGPSERILERMTDAGVKNEIGELSQNYNAGLDAYFAGDKEEAINSLQAVLDKEPQHETALKYMGLAKKLPDPFPLGLVAVIVVGTLAVIGGLVATLLVLRRRGGSGGSAGGGAPGPTVPATPAVTYAPAPAPTPAAPTPSPDPVGTTSTLTMEPPQDHSPPQTTATDVTPRPETVGFQPIGTPPAPPQSSASRFCTSCGTKAEAEAKFCLNCGKPL